MLRFARQFKYRNLRSGTEPDGQAGGADAAIDVKLRAGFFVPSASLDYSRSL